MSWTHDLSVLAFLDDANNLHLFTTNIEELEPREATQFEAGFLEVFASGYTLLRRP